MTAAGSSARFKLAERIYFAINETPENIEKGRDDPELHRRTALCERTNQGKAEEPAACTSQTASPFGGLNSFCFEILSDFLGSLQLAGMPVSDCIAQLTRAAPGKGRVNGAGCRAPVQLPFRNL